MSPEQEVKPDKYSITVPLFHRDITLEIDGATRNRIIDFAGHYKKRLVIAMALGITATASGIYFHHQKEKKEKFPEITEEMLEEFSQIYDEYRLKIRAYITKHLIGDRSEISDVCQVVFTKAFLAKARGQYKPYPEIPNPMQSWLYTIAKNTISNWNRGCYRQRYPRELDEERYRPGPKTVEIDPLLDEVTERVVTDFSAFDQLIFYLRHGEKLPPKKIAQIVGKTHGSIKSRLFRLLEKLRRYPHPEELTLANSRPNQPEEVMKTPEESPLPDEGT